MRNNYSNVAWMCGTLLVVAVAQGASIGTGFTYQGTLQNASGPVTDTCNFRYSLWDASSAGNQVGPTLTFDGGAGNPPAVTVSGGLFNTILDFGAGSIVGVARWLRIEVVCQNDPAYPTYATLSPRVELKPTPHALALPGLYTLENATSPNVVGGYAGNNVNAGVVGATISGGGDPTNSWINSVTSNFGTVSGGYNNVVSATEASIGGGISNIASGVVSTIAGGQSGTASGMQSTVGGGFSCRATNRGATVGGGRGNLATNMWSTVGGGDNNQANGQESAVCGGLNNLANGLQATVGGGGFNTAGGQGSTIGGGNVNMASAQESTVGGGFN